jgi:hypothetical protein
MRNSSRFANARGEAPSNFDCEILHSRPNALVQLQAQYNHCGEAASEKVLVCCNVR